MGFQNENTLQMSSYSKLCESIPGNQHLHPFILYEGQGFELKLHPNSLIKAWALEGPVLRHTMGNFDLINVWDFTENMDILVKLQDSV